MLYMQHISQHVKTLLCCLTFIDDNRIIHITAFDEVGLQQRFYITDKDKGTGGSNL